MDRAEFEIRRGLPPGARWAAARLYWQAFSDKLARSLGSERRAIAYLSRAFDPAFALAALDGGRLIGLAGFQTAEGGFTRGPTAEAAFAQLYGPAGLWRGALLGLLDRPVGRNQLVMDGICVAAEARGQGVGSALIHAMAAEARAHGLTEIRLDVIAQNRRARALYERHGFRATGATRMGMLAPFFGFDAVTTMLAPAAQPAPK